MIQMLTRSLLYIVNLKFKFKWTIGNFMEEKTVTFEKVLITILTCT